MNEQELTEALQASFDRDVNTVRMVTQMQINHITTAYNNLSVIIGTIKPELLEEYTGMVTFAMSDVSHIVSLLLGDEVVISDTEPPEVYHASKQV